MKGTSPVYTSLIIEININKKINIIGSNKNFFRCEANFINVIKNCIYLYFCIKYILRVYCSFVH